MRPIAQATRGSLHRLNPNRYDDGLARLGEGRKDMDAEACRQAWCNRSLPGATRNANSAVGEQNHNSRDLCAGKQVTIWDISTMKRVD